MQTFGLILGATLMAAGAATLAFYAARWLGATVRANRARTDEADQMEAARLRLLNDGVDVDSLADLDRLIAVHNERVRAGHPDRTDLIVDMDDRTAELVIDPTLTVLDVRTAAEHVAPGVGSLASFAAVRDDTRMRTAAERAELEHAWDEALAEVEEQEVRLFMADFDRAMHAALTDFTVGTRRVSRAAAAHDADVDQCQHCRAALEEVSAEFAALVELADSTPTGAMSRRDLEAIWAADGLYVTA